MAEKFAFESEEVSIAFPLIAGLGDAVIAKKIFDSIIELAPDCVIDIFCPKGSHKFFAKSFFGQSKNLNLILDYGEFYQKLLQKYDLAICLNGSYALIIEWADSQRLQVMSPKLFESLVKINEYNKLNVFNIGSSHAISLRNFAMSKILNKNCYKILSCNGALPIHDDKVDIPLVPEYRSKFDTLKLDKYITIYTDIDERDRAQPKVKTWPIQHLREYVARMKKRYPAIEIIQCGGGDIKVENADRHFLGVDLELTKYILANSLLHVGCEGGLIHLATALGTKCVVLFGYTSVNYYGYDRNINLVSEICHPCMEVWGDSNFKICMLGAKIPPCMLSITPQLVCEVTCNYLKHLD